MAIYKIRTDGGCVQTGKCTGNCPIGIDVSYEINEYKKVVNTNCTNCMICTDGCPTSALTYSFANPLKENYQLMDFFNGEKAYNYPKIANLFLNIRKKG